MSGAILSRNSKCTIMGLGSWKRKRTWPLHYVRTVEEMKLFGIYIKDSYRSIIKRNWEYRFLKISNCVKSWSSKYLPSLKARAQILNIFALSRVFYVASILPMSKTMAKKFESVMGKFIWNSSGWFLRVAIEEVKNRTEKGGLGLICVLRMCKSLLLSQFLRLLKSSHYNSVYHVAFWIGDSLVDLRPDMDTSLHANDIPEYFAVIESLVVYGRIDCLVTPQKWKSLTNKMIYNDALKTLPLPKVEFEAGYSFKRIWNLISSPVLQSAIQDIAYLLVHNKLPLPQMLFRLGVKNDPYCGVCDSAQFCDAEHYFCLCKTVSAAWQKIRPKLVSLIGVDVPDESLIRFMFPVSRYDTEVVWLLGNYLAEIWKLVHIRGDFKVKCEELFGFLKFKYKQDQQGARVHMNIIIDIV